MYNVFTTKMRCNGTETKRLQMLSEALPFELK